MKGAYVLITHLRKDSRIKIGSLGNVNFSKGYYCYVGSAMGKNINLKNRIDRYKEIAKNKKGSIKWHIDYFLVSSDVSIVKAVTFKSDKKVECKISQILEKIAEKTIVKFGSSDCKCRGHFHYFKNKEDCEKGLEGVNL